MQVEEECHCHYHAQNTVLNYHAQNTVLDDSLRGLPLEVKTCMIAPSVAGVAADLVGEETSV